MNFHWAGWVLSLGLARKTPPCAAKQAPVEISFVTSLDWTGLDWTGDRPLASLGHASSQHLLTSSFFTLIWLRTKKILLTVITRRGYKRPLVAGPHRRRPEALAVRLEALQWIPERARTDVDVNPAAPPAHHGSTQVARQNIGFDMLRHPVTGG